MLIIPEWFIMGVVIVVVDGVVILVVYGVVILVVDGVDDHAASSAIFVFADDRVVFRVHVFD